MDTVPPLISTGRAPAAASPIVTPAVLSLTLTRLKPRSTRFSAWMVMSPGEDELPSATDARSLAPAMTVTVRPSTVASSSHVATAGRHATPREMAPESPAARRVSTTTSALTVTVSAAISTLPPLVPMLWATVTVSDPPSPTMTSPAAKPDGRAFTVSWSSPSPRRIVSDVPGTPNDVVSKVASTLRMRSFAGSPGSTSRTAVSAPLGNVNTASVAPPALTRTGSRPTNATVREPRVTVPASGPVAVMTRAPSPPLTTRVSKPPAPPSTTAIEPSASRTKVSRVPDAPTSRSTASNVAAPTEPAPGPVTAHVRSVAGPRSVSAPPPPVNRTVSVASWSTTVSSPAPPCTVTEGTAPIGRRATTPSTVTTTSAPSTPISTRLPPSPAETSHSLAAVGGSPAAAASVRSSGGAVASACSGSAGASVASPAAAVVVAPSGLGAGSGGGGRGDDGAGSSAGAAGACPGVAAGTSCTSPAASDGLIRPSAWASPRTWPSSWRTTVSRSIRPEGSSGYATDHPWPAANASMITAAASDRPSSSPGRSATPTLTALRSASGRTASQSAFALATASWRAASDTGMPASADDAAAAATIAPLPGVPPVARWGATVAATRSTANTTRAGRARPSTGCLWS